MTDQMHDGAARWVWLSQKLGWCLSEAADLILNCLIRRRRKCKNQLPFNILHVHCTVEFSAVKFKQMLHQKPIKSFCYFALISFLISHVIMAPSPFKVVSVKVTDGEMF